MLCGGLLSRSAAAGAAAADFILLVTSESDVGMLGPLILKLEANPLSSSPIATVRLIEQTDECNLLYGSILIFTEAC